MLEIYLPVFERLLCSIYSETERSSGSEETLFETRNMHVYIRNASFLLARRIDLTLFSLDLIYFEPVQVRDSQIFEYFNRMFRSRYNSEPNDATITIRWIRRWFDSVDNWFRSRRGMRQKGRVKGD